MQGAGPSQLSVQLISMGDKVMSGRESTTKTMKRNRIGLPIAEVLREQTKEMRLARRQPAEEKAQQATVKILSPCCCASSRRCSSSSSAPAASRS